MMDRVAKVFARAGLPEDALQAFSELSTRIGQFFNAPESGELLNPEVPLQSAGTSWKFIVGRGHSPELVGLYSSDLNIVITSDQVLPGIFPNVGIVVYRADTDPDADPMGLYLDTLRPFRGLPEDALVLPSHRMPFVGIRFRVDALTNEGMLRLDTARAACSRGATAADVMVALFRRKMHGPQMMLALSNTLACLNYLTQAGEIVRSTDAAADRYSVA
jgi:glyoxylase-like metal-dependent hydrolase (beta-lactamase superfamily II)